MTSNITISFFLIAISCTLISCDGNHNRANLLNPDVKYRADTMFAHHRTAIIKELDSLCLLQMPTLVEQATDSLLALDQARIDKILNRKN